MGKGLFEVIMKGETLSQDDLNKLSSTMQKLMLAPKKVDEWSVIWETTIDINLKELARTLVHMGFPEGFVTQDKTQILWARANDSKIHDPFFSINSLENLQ